MDWRGYQGFESGRPRRSLSPDYSSTGGSRRGDLKTARGSNASALDSPESSGHLSGHLASPRPGLEPTVGRTRMPAGCKSDKDKASGSNDSNGTPHPNFPCVSVAIHNLGNELFLALAEYLELCREFDDAVATIKNWAETSTLDKIWTNMIDKAGKSKERRNKADRVTTLRIAGCKQILAGCLENVSTGRNKRGPWHERDWEEEDKARMAEKLIAHCIGIIGLSRDALHSRKACDYFIKELQDALTLLSKKRHKWISEASIRDLSIADKASNSRSTAASETDENAPRDGWSRNTGSGASLTAGSCCGSEAAPAENSTSGSTVSGDSAADGNEKAADDKSGW